MALTMKVQRIEDTIHYRSMDTIKVSFPVIPNIFHHISPQLQLSPQAFFSPQPVEKNYTVH